MKIIPENIRVVDFLPRRDTEQNLKYRLCKALESYGFKFFLEYSGRWNAAPGCRFDIVVHDGRYIKAVIETKRKSINARRGELWLNSRQGKKYLSFDLPIFLIYNDDDFVDCLNALHDIVKPGKPA